MNEGQAGEQARPAGAREGIYTRDRQEQPHARTHTHAALLIYPIDGTQGMGCVCARVISRRTEIVMIRQEYIIKSRAKQASSVSQEALSSRMAHRRISSSILNDLCSTVGNCSG